MMDLLVNDCTASVKASRQSLRMALSAGSVLSLTGLWLLAAQSSLDIAREHGPMENLQVAFLVAGVVMILRQAWLKTNPADRFLCVAMVWGYFTVLVLEFDVRPFHVRGLTVLLNGTFRNLWLTLGWIVVVAGAARHRATLFTLLHKWHRRFFALVLFGSAIFWLLGSFAEHSHLFHGARALFVEELMETNAAWLMLLATFGLETDVRDLQSCS